MTETDAMLTLGRQVLAMQPFSVYMGAQLTAFGAERTELVIPLKPEYAQQDGFVHGGVISYAADNALTFVGGLALDPAVLTAEYKINYVRPARGDTLVARASVIATGKRQAVCRCDVLVRTGADEYLCATAQGTVVATGTPAS